MAEGETEVCGICLETLPRWADEIIRFTCCGKGMHNACTEELRASAHRNKCPMCRAPAPRTEFEAHRRALKWAERGKGWAINTIAQDYELGRGVQKSQKTARLWYGRAAEQGSAQSQYNLAIMHYNGQGGPVSMEQARVWYGRAAEQGHAKSQENLSRMLYQGHGGPVSTELAIFWLKRAVAQGFRVDNLMRVIEEIESTCFSCGKRRASGELNMKKCMGCKCAIYCSKGCQLAHWKKNGGHHKTMCKKIQALHLKMAGGAAN